MDILNFVPLLIWMIFVSWVSVHDDRIRDIDDVVVDKSESNARANIFVGGFLMWLIIGMVCSL